MEPDLCPPWWPALLWSLIHRPHGPFPEPDPEPEPEWVKWVKDPTEEILKGLATLIQAHAFLGAKHEELRAQIQHAAVEQMTVAVEQLARR